MLERDDEREIASRASAYAEIALSALERSCEEIRQLAISLQRLAIARIEAGDDREGELRVASEAVKVWQRADESIRQVRPLIIGSSVENAILNREALNESVH